MILIIYGLSMNDYELVIYTALFKETDELYFYMLLFNTMTLFYEHFVSSFFGIIH